jgi:hypothetical protein
MLQLVFDSSVSAHMEFNPEGATVREYRYKEILLRLRNSVPRPELWRRKNWLLPRNNAPAHGSVLVTVLLHPPYSPDLAQCNYFPFSA